MDSKIKLFTICSFAICSFLLAGCKQNNWADWKVQNEIWLADNKTKDNVQVTASGLQYKIIADPTPRDARPNKTSTVICDYTVKLINGYQVDGGNGVSLSLSNTIQGFAEGCTKIHTHGDIELYVPAYLGYDNTKYKQNDYANAEGNGTEGTMGYIPPYSTLIFNIHLCGISGE